MTEHKIPNRECSIWAKYFERRMLENGASVEKLIEEVSSGYPGHGTMALRATRPDDKAEIEFYIRMSLDRYESAQTLAEILDESIKLTYFVSGPTDLTLQFAIKDGIAKVENIIVGDPWCPKHGKSLPRLQIPYSEGVDYDPKQVIDYLVDSFCSTHNRTD